MLKQIPLKEVGVLADSSITKRALAAALKELMEARPFSQISVSDICEKCEMNRKSFYYHFRDKYDLVNWIYHTEFVAAARQKDYSVGWDLLEDLCGYFYSNRDFYRKTFDMAGQNSFSDYFRDIVAAILTDDLTEFFGEEEPIDFFVDFYADAFVCSIKRWLSKKDCMPAEEFSRRIKRCLIGISDKLLRDFPDEAPPLPSDAPKG